MTEVNQLEMSLKKLSTCSETWKRPPLEKAVLLWGGRVYQWTQETMLTLGKQLRWLDTHPESPAYDARFLEWETLLRQYERACDVLADAQRLSVADAA